jgi:hypothetical protein
MFECTQRLAGNNQDVAYAGQSKVANNGGISSIFCQRMGFVIILEGSGQI